MGYFNNINTIAWWGAITGSCVLIWDILKWIKSGPKLKIRIKPHTAYFDSEVISVEKTAEGHKSKTMKLYHHVEVTNRGNLPSTILNIEAGVKNFVMGA